MTSTTNRSVRENKQTSKTDSHPDLAGAATAMKQILRLDGEPVAVFLVKDSNKYEYFTKISGHRYCQALMRARAGESLYLECDGIACPAAAAAFGFKPLPKGLASGKGLVGFGIVGEPMVGKTMFDGMPRLAPGSLTHIVVCPLAAAPAVPDVVVVEGQPEQLMWIALADLNRMGGLRRHGDTAVLQATCVDATIIPYVEQRLNFSLGCYGCREATDMGVNETILGFPGISLSGIVGQLERLNAKAMGNSRSKSVFHSLKKKLTE